MLYYVILTNSISTIVSIISISVCMCIYIYIYIYTRSCRPTYYIMLCYVMSIVLLLLILLGAAGRAAGFGAGQKRSRDTRINNDNYDNSSNVIITTTINRDEI